MKTLAIGIVCVLLASCSPERNIHVAVKHFSTHRKVFERLLEMEKRNVRPSGLLQISTDPSLTLYRKDASSETLSDAMKMAPNQKVVEEYRTVVEKLDAIFIRFYGHDAFQVVYMQVFPSPPREIGVYYSSRKGDESFHLAGMKIEDLGGGWFAYSSAAAQ